MSTEATEPNRAAVTFDVVFSETPPFHLPTLGDGGHIAAELVACRDLTDRPVSLPTVDADTSNAHATDHLRLPRFTIPNPPVLSLKADLRVETALPAYYARASALVGDSLTLDFRFTCRPQAHYLFVAAYFVRALDGAPGSFVEHCYSVRTLPFNDGDDFRERVESTLREEARDLNSGARSPFRPYVGFAWPLIDGFSVGCRDVVEVNPGFPGKPFTMKFDAEGFDSLLPIEQRAVREVMELMAPRALLPEGPRPKITSETASAHFDETRSFVEALLKLIPHASWPPFNTRLAASTFLKQRIEATEDEIGMIVELLMKGQRRPSARGLAVRFLHKTTGLSEQRIYELIRR